MAEKQKQMNLDDYENKILEADKNGKLKPEEDTMSDRIISMLGKMNCYLDQYIEKHFGWAEEERRRRIERKKAAIFRDQFFYLQTCLVPA